MLGIIFPPRDTVDTAFAAALYFDITQQPMRKIGILLKITWLVRLKNRRHVDRGL